MPSPLGPAGSLNIELFQGTGRSEAATISLVKGQPEIKDSECVRYTLSLVDDRGAISASGFSVALALSGELDGDFYSDSTCATSASTSLLLAGREEAVFYFKDADDTDSPTLSVDDPFAILATGLLDVDVIP